MLLRGQAKKSHRIKEIWLVSLPPRIRNCWTAEKCDHHLEIGNCRELLHGKALSSIYKKILITLPPFPQPPLFFILGIHWRSSGVPKWTNVRYDSVVQKGLNLNNYIKTRRRWSTPTSKEERRQLVRRTSIPLLTAKQGGA